MPVVGGEGLTYLDSRPAGGSLTSLRLFADSAREVARIGGLALDPGAGMIVGTTSAGIDEFDDPRDRLVLASAAGTNAT